MVSAATATTSHATVSFATSASSNALLSAMCGSKRPFSATLHHHALDGSAHASADPTQKRSPLLCGYPSKKCWAWRVEKRNGELHKFCEYHRQKANTNQRRMEQRRKNGRAAKDANNNANNANNSNNTASADSDASKTTKSVSIKQEVQGISTAATSASADSVVVKTEVVDASAPTTVKTPPSINTVMANAERAAATSSSLKNNALHALTAASPRGVEHFDYISPPLFSWAEVDLDIGMDAAVEYMMIDHAIDSEPSDKPVDLYEEDLYFLEHFIAEIAATGV